jgi:tRNA(fMet)-specific endonuclease VapC
MSRYLLDTNVLSQVMLPRGDPGVLERLRTDSRDCAVPSPVVHELVYGCERMAPGARRSRLEQFVREAVCAALPILDYDAAAATWHARERARLERQGRAIGATDGQIAAIGAVNHLTLVTANVRHFEVFEGLNVEDWTGRR